MVSAVCGGAVVIAGADEHAERTENTAADNKKGKILMTALLVLNTNAMAAVITAFVFLIVCFIFTGSFMYGALPFKAMRHRNILIIPRPQ